jgi:hypothetical protein
MNSVTSDTSLSGFLGQGIGPLLASRILGFVSAIQVFFVIACSAVLAPFVVVGAWARRRSIDFGPFFLYAGLLFGAAGLVFAVHVPYGTFLHSAVALVPISYILELEGVVIVATWVARRRRGWTEDRAARLFLIAAVGTVLLNAGAFGFLAARSWNQERDMRLDASAALDRTGAPKTDLLLSADPGGFEYFTGHGGVVTPNDSLAVIREVAADYGTRWLIVERAHIVTPLAPILEMKSRPDWIGPPIFTIPYTGEKTGDPAIDAAPALAIFPICTSAGDTRCSTGATP